MKRKIFTICFALTFVAACGLSGLKQPTHAEQSTTTDYDQEIRQAEEEKKKAYQYKEAFMNYTSLGIDEQAYLSNLLEVEAHTAQAEAAFEKLEEYNKRHEES